MKFVSISTPFVLASLVAADVLDPKMNQRSLNVLSSKRLAAVRRNLRSSACMDGQITIEDSGIHDELIFDVDLAIRVAFCDITLDSEGVDFSCDYSKSDIDLDTEECKSLGGRKVTLDSTTSCDTFSREVINMPYCLHESCTVKDLLPDESMDDDYDDGYYGECDYLISESGVRPLNSIHILPIAILSTFAMIW